MSKEGKYLTLTEENFENEVLKSSKPVVVDFWADWCGPCRVMAPVIDEMAADSRDTAKIAKVNIEVYPGLVACFNVQSIPTLLYFRGGEVADRVIGVVPKEVLVEKLSALSKAA